MLKARHLKFQKKFGCSILDKNSGISPSIATGQKDVYISVLNSNCFEIPFTKAISF
jgi:hypothetical protein